MSKKKQTRRPARLGTGVGKGHGGITALSAIRPIPLPPPLEVARQNGLMELDTKAYTLGACTILCSHSHLGWHMSIAHPQRYPTWDEVAKARYELIPDEATMAMMLPPKAEYINIHSFCFQLHEVQVGNAT